MMDKTLSIWMASLLILLAQPGSCATSEQATVAPVLKPENFRHYFAEFVEDEKEMLGDAPVLPWEWFVRNIPWLDVPDQELQEIY